MLEILKKQKSQKNWNKKIQPLKKLQMSIDIKAHTDGSVTLNIGENKITIGPSRGFNHDNYSPTSSSISTSTPTRELAGPVEKRSTLNMLPPLFTLPEKISRSPLVTTVVETPEKNRRKIIKKHKPIKHKKHKK